MATQSIIQALAQGIGRTPGLGPFLRRLAGGRLHIKSRFKHPFDTEYGVDTSGIVPAKKIVSDKTLAGKIRFYMGVQPSVVRRALATLPDLSSYSFIDIGCGKGRPTIIASEFPFKKIMGVELSPELAEIARANAALIHKEYPARTRIEIVTGNAVDFPIPTNKLILFLFNSFGEELATEFRSNIEKQLRDRVAQLFLIYYNPIFGHLFDTSPALVRWHASNAASEPSEQDYGPNPCATVIWQSKQGAIPTPHFGHDRKIVLTGSMNSTLETGTTDFRPSQ